jgi:hypothetical protein
VKTKLAFVLSFLLLFSLLSDGIEARGELDDTPEEEASAIDVFAISLRFNDSGRFRSPQAERKSLSVTHAQPKYSVFHPGKNESSRFSRQELYRLQEVYRL